jgi:alpha-glucosidase
MRTPVAALSLLALGTTAMADTTVTLESPNGAIRLEVFTRDANGGRAESGQLAYSVSFRGKPVIEASALGLNVQGEPAPGRGVATVGRAARIETVHRSAIDETYTIPAGKSNPVRNHANAATIVITDSVEGPFALDARAYDDGVAFRYAAPPRGDTVERRIANEATEFRLAKDGMTYPLILPNFHTSYEDDYHRLPLSGIHQDALIALPFLAELPGTAWVAITEADIDNYAGLYLRRNGRDSRTLTARLAPRIDNPDVSVVAGGGIQSPWRVIMIGDRPGALIESNIVLNLNPPCAIADTSWIKPGKAAWNWWSGTLADNVSFQPGMNTETMNHYIDFAADSKFEYMMIDAGWAAGYRDGSGSSWDITRTAPNVDMNAILGHARARRVGVWLWSHWTDVNRQMDEAFPLFEKWGIKGVKIDFMDRDDQEMVGFYRRVARTAAAHHLMIDFHGAFKPDGLRRTWPNVLTREGVMGLEYNKWSARITPDHNVMLAFTRMLAGPMDYTPGGFLNVTHEEFVPRNRRPMVMTTRAHQLALFVVFESALQMVSDYPEAYTGTKELAFLSGVPSSWDETRVLDGRVGDYIAIARRRGKDWYVGAITGSRAETQTIPLTFLSDGEYQAEIYADAPDAGQHPTHTRITRRKVTRSTRLRLDLAPAGGQAIRIAPVKQ